MAAIVFGSPEAIAIAQEIARNEREHAKLKAVFDSGQFSLDEAETLWGNCAACIYGAFEALDVFFDDLADATGLDPQAVEEILLQLLDERDTE